MIPVTCGYARVSKTNDATRNLETQLHILQEFGIREEHIFADEMTGSSTYRPAWNELMTQVRPSETIVVAWLDRFSRNFDEGVRIQVDLTKQNVGIVAIRENINTTDDSAAAKLFRRMMMARGPTRWTPPANGSGQVWSVPGPRGESLAARRLLRRSRKRNAGVRTPRHRRSGV